uniref:Somatostatin n=1 Tax=Cyanistes caeruleus TaxID=156563 RepID=A0A8C0UXH4_CYACU
MALSARAVGREGKDEFIPCHRQDSDLFPTPGGCHRHNCCIAAVRLGSLERTECQTENEALESEDLSRGAEQDEVRLELERSANSNPALAPRERKAGCKNFFWKTFTSC